MGNPMTQPILKLDAAGTIESITIPRPSDFHQHFRWEGMIDAIAPDNIRHNKYVLAMPNNGPDKTDDPKVSLIKTLAGACRVYHRIMDIKAKHKLETFAFPLMTIYLSRETTPEMIERCKASKIVYAVKSYPAHGATTNSGFGMPFDECDDTIKAMIRCKMPLLIHAEDATDFYGHYLPHEVREEHCIKWRLRRFREKYPDLEIVIEHMSTIAAINLLKEDQSGKTRGTITPQHLLFTKDDLASLSWRNHLRCMPYVKTEDDRQALLELATSGNILVSKGTDKADHVLADKNKPFEQAACGCSVPHADALYTIAFMQKKAINANFVRFMSHNGPDAWHLSRPADNDAITICMVREGEKDIPDPLQVPAKNDVIVPLGWTESVDRLKIGYITAMAT